MPASKLDKLEDQRRALIRFIETEAPQGSRKNAVTVVFDGSQDAFGGMDTSEVKVIFSSGESADDRIRKIVAASGNAKNIVVVTDDREIQYAVGALGAKVSSVKEFLGAGKPRGQKKKQTKSSASEPEKYISKTDEARINAEMGDIWLKPDSPDE